MPAATSDSRRCTSYFSTIVPCSSNSLTTSAEELAREAVGVVVEPVAPQPVDRDELERAPSRTGASHWLPLTVRAREQAARRLEARAGSRARGAAWASEARPTHSGQNVVANS